MNGYLNQVGHPAQTANRGPAGAPVQQPAASSAPTGGKKSKRKFSLSRVAFVVFSVLVAIVLVGSIILLFRGQGGSTTSQIKTAQYQAVFLNSADGQVYFGKLSVLNRDYYKLTDIYYVRVQQVQPDKNNTQPQQNISLAKLGNEIHGPEDVMYINKNSVMFWENLKDSGQVVQAIKKYQQNPSQSSTTNTNTPASSTPATK